MVGDGDKLPLSVRLREGHFIDEPPMTFTRYTVSGFPILTVNEKHVLEKQDTLDGFGGPANTTFLAIERLNRTTTLRYWVEHETWIKQLARFGVETVPKVKKVVRYNVFLDPSEPNDVWFQVKKQYAEETLRRLRKLDNWEMTASRHETDILAMLDAYQQSQGIDGTTIFGAWFVGLRIPKVRTAMLQGVGVDESTEFERYRQAGDLASLELILDYQGALLKVIVTKKGTIVIRSRIDYRLAMEVLRYVANMTHRFTTPVSINWQGRS